MKNQNLCYRSNKSCTKLKYRFNTFPTISVDKDAQLTLCLVKSFYKLTPLEEFNYIMREFCYFANMIFIQQRKYALRKFKMIYNQSLAVFVNIRCFFSSFQINLLPLTFQVLLKAKNKTKPPKTNTCSQKPNASILFSTSPPASCENRGATYCPSWMKPPFSEQQWVKSKSRWTL